MNTIKIFNRKKLILFLTVITVTIATIAIGFIKFAPKTVYISGTLVERNFEDLYEQSALIALGTVTEKSEAFQIQNVSGSIANFTDYSFKINSTLRGNADNDTVTVRVQGGTVGNYTEIYEFSPDLEKNKEYLLFLYKPGRGGAYNTEGDYYYVLGLTQGSFSEDQTGNFISQSGEKLTHDNLIATLDSEESKPVDENYFRNEYIENQKRNLQNGFITQQEFDDMMANIGSVLNTTLEDAGVKYKTFIDSLQSCLDVVNHNRQELAPQTAQAAAITGSYHDNDGAKDDDDDLLDDLGEN